MNRFGLALSGGGFRAVLYHLGLVRFLRDAGILSRVTHISSVSGGSVIGRPPGAQLGPLQRLAQRVRRRRLGACFVRAS